MSVINTLVKNAFACYNNLSKLQVKFSEDVARADHLVMIETTTNWLKSAVTGRLLLFGGKSITCKTVDDVSTASYESDMFAVTMNLSGPFPCRYILGHFLHALAEVAAEPNQIAVAIPIITSVIEHFNKIYATGKALDYILVDTEAADNLALKTAECENLREKVKKLEEDLVKRDEQVAPANDILTLGPSIVPPPNTIRGSRVVEGGIDGATITYFSALKN